MGFAHRSVPDPLRSYDSKGRIRLEEESAARRELGRSPDKADACLLGFAAATKRGGRYALIGGLFDCEKMEYVDQQDPTRAWGEL